MPGPPRRPLLERLWEKVKVGGPDDCWLFEGALTSMGYGQVNEGGHSGRRLAAHRVVYESEVGAVPDGHEIDHLCETRACVNPAHLEAVTHQDNMLRFHGQRTLCRYGHPLDGLTRAKTPTGRPTQHRFCRTCSREKNRRLRAIALEGRKR